MNSKDFIIWLKGFTEGIHDFNITPKQWDLLKEKLDQVSDEPKPAYPFGVPNGTFISNPAITTTPGTTGYVTVTNPNIASFGGVSSITYTTGSSAWSYTTTNNKIY
jgi:hypothetical protein